MLAERHYRFVFRAAAVYNVGFGLWAALAPGSFFALFAMDPPRYPQIWQCLGMVVGLYGLLYWYAGAHPGRARPIIAVGLLGKLLGPAGFLYATLATDWPARAFPLVLANDLIWWFPFAAFLLRPGER